MTPLCPVEKLVEVKTSFKIALSKDRAVGINFSGGWLQVAEE